MMRGMRSLTGLLLLTLLAPTAIFGQQLHTLRGQVKDQLGALVAGVEITLENKSGKVISTKTNAQGSYVFEKLPPGKYKLAAVAEGFAPFLEAQLLIPHPQNSYDIKLSIEVEAQQVTVGENRGLGVEANQSASALVLRGEELELLPDDPEDLAASLRNLAGPGAGPNGGEIFVDGFSGGRVPPKSSIREVRVSNNPFNAENDQPGFGRIDILTRPGMDKFRGSAAFGFNDESLNSRNPFALARPDFQTRLYNLNFGGPLIAKRASYLVDFQRREEDDSVLINADVLTPTLQVANLRQTLIAPRRVTVFNPRFDFAINPNHTLVARYSYTRDAAINNGVGAFSLAARAFNQSLSEHQLQLTETAILSSTVINETRFQFINRSRDQEAGSNAPALVVLNSFSGGGSQVFGAFNQERRWTLENYTTMTRGRHILRFGIFLRRVSIKDISPLNFNGTYTFTGGQAPLLNAANQVVLDANGNPVIVSIDSLERFRRTVLFQQQGLAPAQIRTLGGGAAQLTIAGGNSQASVKQFDLSPYFQDEWHFRPNLVMTYGLRYEYQTNIQSPLNFAPRLFVAWAPGAGGTGTSGGSGTAQPKLVIRAGSGIFYERFNELGTLEALRFNGTTELRYNVLAPAILDQAIFTYNGVSNVPSINSLNNLGIPQNITRVADTFQSPYTFLNGIQIERKLPYNFNFFVLAFRYRTLHVLRLRNANAPLPGTFNPNLPNNGVRPLSGVGDIYQYESSGVYLDNRIFIGIKKQFNRQFSFFANYSAGIGKTNSECAFGILTACFPANSYDLRGEYGRVSFLPTHRAIAGGTFSIPQWKLTLSPLIIASTGQFFNITTGRDTNGDGLYTERPAFATPQTRPQDLRVTRYGSFDINPSPGTPLIPRNFGEGPNFIVVNLNTSWTVGLDKWLRPAAATTATKAAPGTATAQRAAEPRYRLTFTFNIQNLFNNVNFNTPVGDLSSPFFGQSTGVAGSFGAGSPNSAGGNRRVQTQIRFTF